MQKIVAKALSVMALLAAGVFQGSNADAALIYFIGGDGLGQTAATAEANFLAAATGITLSTDEFDEAVGNDGTGNGPGSFVFAGSGITAATERFSSLFGSLNDYGGVWQQSGANSFGLPNDANNRLGWKNGGGTAAAPTDGGFTFTMPTAVNAFSVDIMDFGQDSIPSTSTWDFTVSVDGGGSQLIASSTVGSQRVDNNVIFFGVVDTATAFTSLAFNNSGINTSLVGSGSNPFSDSVAFDRLQYGADSGSSTNPALTTNPANGGTLQFGPVRVGTTSSPQAITATNTGDPGSTLTGEFPAAPGEFGPNTTEGMVPLDQNEQDSRDYTYTPTARGGDTTNVVVDGDAAGSSTITLAGTGVGPVFDSSEGTSGTIDFGSIDVDDTTQFVLELLNTSPDDDGGTSALTDLTINDIQLVGLGAGNFSVIGFTAGSVIGQGSSLNVTLEYDPLAIGTQTATLQILTDVSAALGGNGVDFEFTLQGNAFQNSPPGPGAIPEPSSFVIASVLTALAGFSFRRRR